jgi:hypothetical protein
MATRRAIICTKIRDDSPDYIAIFSILAALPVPAIRLAIDPRD